MWPSFRPSGYRCYQTGGKASKTLINKHQYAPLLKYIGAPDLHFSKATWCGSTQQIYPENLPVQILQWGGGGAGGVSGGEATYGSQVYICLYYCYVCGKSILYGCTFSNVAILFKIQLKYKSFYTGRACRYKGIFAYKNMLKVIMIHSSHS